MTATQTVAAPDGRQWVIESRPSKVPPWRGFLPRESSEGGGCVGGFFIRLLFVLVIGLVIGLVVWLIELPFSLLFSRRRMVTARTEGKELSWRTHAKHEQAVVSEVAAALAAGQQEVAPTGAVKA